MDEPKSSENQEITEDILETEDNDTETISKVQEILKKIDETPKAKKLLKEFDSQFKEISIREILETDEKIQEEILAVKKERKEYLDSLQRFKADFENYKKRAQKQEESSIRYSSERILSKVFEPIEDMSRIIDFAKKNNDDKVPLDGIEMTFNKLLRILEDEGVSIISPKPGDSFDPQYHEAVCVDNTGKFGANKVTQQFEKGYKIKDRVIRASKVMVSTEEGEKEAKAE
jgi:molecular chaperone GrpE